MLCIVRQGGLPDELSASTGRIAEPATHARETLGGDGCATFVLDVNRESGTTQMLWGFDGQSTLRIVEVDVAG